ncbi:MAG: hypothetical protein IJD23_06630 [Spirochaetaceae bacterium]|nr:hypothetical protein [Spirochaetaceae bacterium]
MNEQNQQPIQKWEYIKVYGPDIEKLNELGEQGWDVVDGIVYGGGREVVFKRPKQTKPTNDYGYSR